MNKEKETKADNKLFFLEKQTITLENFESQGLILDIGGGGEGVIGQLKGEQVVAIDKSLEELEEAEPGPLKIQMDASALKFLDESFRQVTAFYGLMFMKPALQKAVLKEVFRVLKPGGVFHIWDIQVESPGLQSTSGFAFYLTVNMPGKTIETGYGFHWPDRIQDIDYYRKIVVESGFDILDEQITGLSFLLRLQKPEIPK
ncbi:MAG: class I SAM-dependent methyltransferase [Anaerolineaceae bacterium]|nr:class I SAM-dependent methyltransferase [Anaerolineaceae bacterium]